MEFLGKKRYIIDQPNVNPQESVAGSGWQNITTGSLFGSPSIDSSSAFNDAFSNSPTFDAPSVAWT